MYVNGNQGWYNLDDDHYDASPPKFSAKGGNNENGDMCAWSYGTNPANLYLTTNTAGNLAVKGTSFNANQKVGDKYFLTQLQYVYAPPNSQCAMDASKLQTLLQPTLSATMSFYNGFQDTNQYYIVMQLISLKTAWTKAWVSPAVGYGKHVEFSKLVPPGQVIKKWSVVRASDNKIVFKKNGGDDDVQTPFTLDNTNGNMIAFWGDSNNQMFSARYGYSGSFTSVNYVFANCYQTSKYSNVAPVNFVIKDGMNKQLTPTSVNTQFYGSGGWGGYSIGSGVASTSGVPLDMSGWTFQCTADGKPAYTAPVPPQFTITPGSVVFILCLGKADIPAVVYSTATQTITAATANPTRAPSTPGATVVATPAPTNPVPTFGPTMEPTFQFLPTRIPTTFAPSTAGPTLAVAAGKTAIPTQVTYCLD